MVSHQEVALAPVAVGQWIWLEQALFICLFSNSSLIWDMLLVLQLQSFHDTTLAITVLLLNSFLLALDKGLTVENIRRFMHSILFIQLTSQYYHYQHDQHSKWYCLLQSSNVAKKSWRQRLLIIKARSI